MELFPLIWQFPFMSDELFHRRLLWHVEETQLWVLDAPINAARVRSVCVFHVWSAAVWGRHTHTHTTHKNPLWLTESVCAQEKGTRLRLHLYLVCLFAPDRSGYGTTSTTQDVKEVFCTERLSKVRLFEGGTAQRNHCLAFFFFPPLSLRSSLTGKWDAGYAASPVSLE